MVRTLDDYYGRILDTLDEQGLADNTLVIATTDHGLAFPLMKCRLTDHGMGVLLIVRGPGFAGGRAIDGLVSQIDLYPTLCEIAGIEPPDWLEGTSLMPLVDGSAQEVNDEIFSEVTYHAAYEPKRAVRTQRYKYVRRYDPQDTAPMANIDASISKDVMVNHGLQSRPPGREQLYDLIWDPHEACNLAGDPDSAGILEDLRGRLDRWMAATSDPLLDGSVPQPPDTWINPHADLHPHEPRRD
jgi:arylsulfatase A-like enzyme